MKLMNKHLNPLEFKTILHNDDYKLYSQCTEAEIQELYRRFVFLYYQYSSYFDPFPDIVRMEHLIGDYSQHAYSIQARLLCNEVSSRDIKYLENLEDPTCLMPEYIDLYIQHLSTGSALWILESCSNITDVLLNNNRILTLVTHINTHYNIEEKMKILRYETPSEQWDLVFEILGLQPARDPLLIHMIHQYGTSVINNSKIHSHETTLFI